MRWIVGKAVCWGGVAILEQYMGTLFTTLGLFRIQGNGRPTIGFPFGAEASLPLYDLLVPLGKLALTSGSPHSVTIRLAKES